MSDSSTQLQLTIYGCELPEHVETFVREAVSLVDGCTFVNTTHDTVPSDAGVQVCFAENIQEPAKCETSAQKVLLVGKGTLSDLHVGLFKEFNEVALLEYCTKEELATRLIRIGAKLTTTTSDHSPLYHIEEERLFFHSIVENSIDIIIVLDGIGNFIFHSQSLQHTLGWEPSELVGKNCLEFVHPQDARTVAHYLKQGRENPGSTFSTKYRIRHRDGYYRTMEAKGSSVRMSDGSVRGIINSRDVTEGERHAVRMRLFQRAVEFSGSLIVLTNEKGLIEYINPAAARVTGFELEEVVGKSTSVFQSGRTPKETYEDLWNTISSGSVWSGQFENKTKDGRPYWVLASIAPIVDEKHNVTHYVAIEEDITEQKSVEAELRDSRDKAEEMNRLKTAFLANINHEVRTPLTGVIGFASLLRDSVSEDDRELVQMIEVSGQRLLRTLDSIIDLSMLEAGSVHLDWREFDAEDLIHSLLLEFKSEAESKGIELRTEVDKPGRYMLTLDIKCLRRILEHIVANAVKFTESGSVSITLSGIDHQEVVFSVIDTGVGISKEFMPVLFNEFRQEEDGLNRSFEGTGLGMAVSRRLASLMGGRIEVESTKGLGSTFRVSFSNTGIDKVSKRKTILVVDDDRGTRLLLERFLMTSYNVKSAASGEEAKELLHELKPDLILMDIHLSGGENGIEAMKSLKELPVATNIPFVAVTVISNFEDQAMFFSEGFSACLGKPFTKKQLFEVCSRLISH